MARAHSHTVHGYGELFTGQSRAIEARLQGEDTLEDAGLTEIGDDGLFLDVDVVDGVIEVDANTHLLSSVQQGDIQFSSADGVVAEGGVGSIGLVAKGTINAMESATVDGSA